MMKLIIWLIKLWVPITQSRFHWMILDNIYGQSNIVNWPQKCQRSVSPNKCRKKGQPYVSGTKTILKAHKRLKNNPYVSLIENFIIHKMYGYSVPQNEYHEHPVRSAGKPAKATGVYIKDMRLKYIIDGNTLVLLNYGGHGIYDTNAL